MSSPLEAQRLQAESSRAVRSTARFRMKRSSLRRAIVYSQADADPSPRSLKRVRAAKASAKVSAVRSAAVWASSVRRAK